MRELVCIVCPKGCTMKIEEKDGEISVTGNSCKRGASFAVSEMTEPKRTVCTTVRTVFKDAPVIPVRVSAEIPKDRIFDVMREINAVTLSSPVGRNDVIIKNVLGLGADVIATSGILKELNIREE
ncbi:MAG: DUF1667 domain-containing protein [Oscillospiraceae bacterium]|nr:DUF1667 domain-containing protein [Oscillospiraceae bacterium]MDD7470014.1 DUF1667 domain-containing protein [Oscillospiraceae bacterium]